MDLTLSALQPVRLLRSAQGDPGPMASFDDNLGHMEKHNPYFPSILPEASNQNISYNPAFGSRDIGKARGAGAMQQRERKAHTKSRRGCFNCKRRRIKCSETQPACGHCLKKGVTCEYPAPPQIPGQPYHQMPLYSLQDMRFFQHFILCCYPHHPLRNEDIWTHEVPCLSQIHEHLMHAILGVAASDLNRKDPNLIICATVHRVKAIEAIKKTLADIPSLSITYEGANALMATCLALTVQSVSFDDGMVEYMTFIRGLLIVGVQMWIKGIKPMFANLVANGSLTVLEPYMSSLPLIHKEWTDGAVMAIEGLRPLCQDPVEIEYHKLLLEMAHNLYISSWEAYKVLEKHYGWWVMLPHEKFQTVIDPNNQIMVLLASHWMSIKQIMAPITEVQSQCWEGKPEPQGSMDQGMIRWLTHLNQQVDDKHQVYNHWPLWVQEKLEQNLGFFGKTR